MAANYSSAEDICEGENCQSITSVTYYVKQKKKLCNECAFRVGCIGKARKGGSNLYCKKHDEEIKLYCKTHKIALCYSCAILDHSYCVRQDIEGAIMESKAKLNILKEKAKDKLKLCRVYGDRIRQCRKDTDTHLQALKREVDSVINEAIKTDKDREKEDAAKINREITKNNQKLQEKIRKNEEEREKRLELNRTNAEKRREPINNKQNGLQTDIKDITEEKERKIGELTYACHHNTQNTENTILTLDTILKDDESVLKDWHHVRTSVNDELKKPLNEDGVKQITSAISGVRFLKGAGRAKYDGRIGGYDGEWKLIDTINIDIYTFRSTFPIIVGCIDECNVIITNGELGGHSTYILNLKTKCAQRVITGRTTSEVDSCALLNDDKVVCGKYSMGKGDSLTGFISVYDRQWNHINDVPIPRNTTRGDTWVDVAVDQDGMIIAAEAGQTKIYVINPADGKIINTITCKENIRMRGVLSSGHIIARPIYHRLCIIDRQGTQREIPHSDPQSDVIMNACIDPMTDDLYLVTSDDASKTFVIDHVMSGSDMKKRRVASFTLPTSLDSLKNMKANLIVSRVMMTSSGKLIVCDGQNILIFKNRFTL